MPTSEIAPSNFVVQQPSSDAKAPSLSAVSLAKLSGRFAGRVAATFALLVVPLAGAAADFRILGLLSNDDGSGHIVFPSDTDHYYLLESGSVVNRFDRTADITLGEPGLAAFTIPPPPDAARTLFYRVREIAVAQPIDADGDGMDDVFELAHPRSLSALDPADAARDFDRDGVSNLQEFRAGTDLERFQGAPLVGSLPAATSRSSLRATGAAVPNGPVTVEGGASVRQTIAQADGTFSLEVPLLTNRLNRLFITSVNPDGTPTAPRAIDVIQDSQPPALFLDFPADHAELTSSEVVVAGRVGDLLSGFLGLQVEVAVAKGEIPAAEPLPAESFKAPANVIVGIGNNGTYEVGGLPLALGPNTIRATAMDQHGNQVTKQSVLRRVALVGPQMAALMGDRQVTNVHRRLAQPLIVRVSNPDGRPIAGKVVTFEVLRSDGRLAAPDPANNGFPATNAPLPVLQLTTDERGEAAAWWTLGGDAGCGNNRVGVTSTDISGTIFFCASADPAPASQINIGSGNNQRVEVGGPVPEPLRAWVNDSCNGVEGMPVTFVVTQGSGRLFQPDGKPAPGEGRELTLPTSRTGHVQVGFQLGPVAGNQEVLATYPGNPGLPAVFTAYGIERNPARATTFMGLVLDNASQPIGGALCTLVVAKQTFTSRSETNGQFRFANLPAGPAQLHVNGLEATRLNGREIPFGSFPSLSYTPVIVPNAENSLPTPVLLPRMNPKNAVVYDGNRDLELTCEGIAGLKMRIKAGSMRLPDGTAVRPHNPAIVALNQVHHDDVPMPIPDGAAPPFAWTLQPSGATFDPPIQIEYPNMSALPVGTIAYFLSFDHATQRFEIVASGHVIHDGSCIVTDPGVGLSVAGWGCNCPPYAVTGGCDCTKSPTIQEEIRALNTEKNELLKKAGDHMASSTAAGVRLAAATASIGVRITKISLALAECGRFLNCGQPLAEAVEDFLSIKEDLEVADDAFNRVGLDLEQAIGAFAGGYAYYDRQVQLCPPLAGAAPAKAAFEERARALRNGVLLAYEKAMARLSSAVSGLEAAIIGLVCPGYPISCARFGRTGRANGAALADEARTLEELLVASKAALDELDRSTAAVSNSTSDLRSSLEAVALDGQALTLDLRKEGWTFSVSGRSASFPSDGLFVMANISARDAFGIGGPGSPPDFLSDDYLRLVGAQIRDDGTRYLFSEVFQIPNGSTYTITNLTFTTTPPRLPETLRIEADHPTLTTLGATTQMRVSAGFADGSSDDVTPRTQWTVYRTSNPDIATVGPNGLVTVHAAGVALITAVNEGVTAVARIDIVPGDPLTTLQGIARDTSGNPVAGASVRVLGAAGSGTTGADGTFTISEVATQFGTPALMLFKNSGGLLFGEARNLRLRPGGITDAGLITLDLVCTECPDTDRDGLADALESRLKTDPSKTDTDGDQLADGEEVFTHGTDPTSPDTDGDGVDDRPEILNVHTHPFRPDTDGDGWDDGVEVADRTDPLDPTSHPSRFAVALPSVEIIVPEPPEAPEVLRGLVVALPPIEVTIPEAIEAPERIQGTVVAFPPVEVVAPEPAEAIEMARGTVIAFPPVEVVLPEPPESPSAQPGITVAVPPVTVDTTAPAKRSVASPQARLGGSAPLIRP